MTERKQVEIAGVFDIECAGWDRFLCGEILDRGGAFQSWNEDEFFRELVSRSGVYYAHAGGRYDMLWCLDLCSRHGYDWTARPRGAGLLTARVGELELRDSYAVVPMSLAKAAPMGGAAKTGLGLPCECGMACGGYCALSRPHSDAERRLIGEYLHHDCVALLAVMDALTERCEGLDISLRLTVGGTAWNTAKRWLDLPSCTHSVGRYRKIREGYYGGRTEVHRTHAPEGERYDIHSSYPAALTRVALPEGEGQMYEGGIIASSRYRAGLPGIYSATVYVDECDVPPLPVRVPGRLLYPWGRFEGAWTAHELAYAESVGARIETFHWAYVFASARPILAPFAQRVWDLRAEAAVRGESAWAAWFKWLANSLTGKCAQKPEHVSLAFIPSEDGVAPLLEHDTSIPPRSTSYGVYLYRPTVRVDACAHVQWAAYLTSEARIELHRQLMHAGDARLYCDTDSVYASRALTRRLGDGLGEWGHEGSLRDWRALAPKVYSYELADGKRVVKGKGMSGLDADGFDALARGESWSLDSGVDGLKTRLRSDDPDALFRRRALTRGLNRVEGWVGGRELCADGSTRATSLARYAQRPRPAKRGAR